MVRQFEAFSPCNITGFFQIHRAQIDPLKNGSTGVSIAIDRGVTTQLTLRRASNSHLRATFNGRPLASKSVSSYVARKFLALAGGTWELRVAHRCELPTGCGFGTSGAGALSLSLALNEALDLSLSNLEAAQIAHISEIACATGLGTVASVFLGGMTIRTKPGAPGEGETRSIHTSPSLRILTYSYGPLATQGVLSSQKLRKRINKCGGSLLNEFNLKNPASSFMSLSKRFANCLGLMSTRVSNAIKRLDSNGQRSSMMMLGESLFSLISNPESLPQNGLRQIAPLCNTSKVSTSGAHLN